MSVAVDTNILLYAVNPNCSEHNAARSAVEELRTGRRPWYLTWGVVYEFLQVATHPAVSKSPLSLSAALSFVRHLLDSSSVSILRETETHLAELEEFARQMPDISANDVHVAHTAVLMREHNIRTILTADKGFARFKNLEVVDPVHA